MQRIVLAYSGSLRTSIAIAWLKARYHADVITVTLDLGQGTMLEEVRDRALALGAVRAHVIDARDQLVREVVLPSLKADALEGGRLVMAAALGRPIVARTLVEIGEIERADAVAHGEAVVAGREPLIDRLVRAVNPGVRVIAPTAEWAMNAGEQRAYAGAHGIVAPADGGPDRNLWGRSFDAADPSAASAPGAMRPPAECPDEPALVEIAFDRGVPKAINGVFMPLLELVTSLGTIAAAHGVGRVALDGAGCEAPAAVLLHAAHRELQRAKTPSDLHDFGGVVSGRYTEIIRDGQWFTPLREALDAFVDRVQERVSGAVRLKLYKGEVKTEP